MNKRCKVKYPKGINTFFGYCKRYYDTVFKYVEDRITPKIYYDVYVDSVELFRTIDNKDILKFLEELKK